ncbi:MAG: hypothetical protein ACSLEL_05345 [Candidatus Malihini olakiniferum]
MGVSAKNPHNARPVKGKSYNYNISQKFIPDKDTTHESNIARAQQKLRDLGFNIEEATWLNPFPKVWFLHIHDKNCLLFYQRQKRKQKSGLDLKLKQIF